MNSELTFKQGLKDTMPTVFGYIGIGIAFGMIGHSEGFKRLGNFITLIDCLRWFSTFYHG